MHQRLYGPLVLTQQDGGPADPAEQPDLLQQVLEQLHVLELAPALWGGVDG